MLTTRREKLGQVGGNWVSGIVELSLGPPESSLEASSFSYYRI
jgi:hypothetical protein